MKPSFFSALALLVSLSSPLFSADPDAFLVRDGQANAEIVIAENPPRTTLLAAQELQRCIRKISGAELPITAKPGTKFPVKIHVGASPFTAKSGISTDGLKFGAYRIVSGDRWMALIGDDTDFIPVEPWARSHSDIASGKMQAAWDRITGDAHWGYPLTQLHKHYTGSTGLFGTEKEQRLNADGQVNFWGFDERGSFNAVCDFLRSLGMRWYLPGELGEVAPALPTIPLPEIDQTVQPDFEVRRFNVRFGIANRDTVLWAAHLGMRDPYGLRVAHGMDSMTHTDAILKSHPDWFALYGGKRDTQPGERLNHLCYSNPELFEETVRWARAQLDQFQFDTVSIMPPDAYISICQCELCEGKDDPERGSRGILSDHVWDFVNRVAKEVGKTHPARQIVCCAYGSYTDPPHNIKNLEPNVQVIIVGGRRPRSSRPDQREEVRALRDGWREKTDNPLMVFENYPFTDRGWYLPAFTARTNGESINATKAYSRGEDIWLSFGKDFDTRGIGFNHFQVWFTARMYWGGPGQDATAMLDEYCRLFYGPAGAAMKAFFHYSEDHWQDMETDKEKVDAALEFFAAARAKTEPDSVYGKRIALIDEFLEALRSKSRLLGRKRGPVPTLRMVWDAEDIVIDGRLDEKYWRECPTAATARFRELQTGRLPVFETSIKSGWGRNDLYFAIRCEENPGEPLNVGTKKSGDQAIFYGDNIEILLETDSHSYYQIVVNPAGAMVDLDRGASKDDWSRWESQAEVATSVAGDHWIVEIRIPVTDDQNDPLNQVVGRKPSESLPWHINLCRQRIRENASEFSALSPTGAQAFHEALKFAHFYAGHSKEFDMEPENDYLQARRDADALYRTGKREEAMNAFAALARRENLTDFQKCDALERAAQNARSVREFDQAAEFASQAPIDAVTKSIRMENMLAERKAKELIEEFGDENLAAWPFWNAGGAFFARGSAHAAMGNGEKAESDLQAALPLTSDSRTRMSILRAIGQNRETTLADDDKALEIYRQIAESGKNTGSAEYYYGLLGAVRILTKQKHCDDALALLDSVDTGKLKGTWLGSFLLARGDTLSAAGRTGEALAAYRNLLASDSMIPQHREKAEAAIRAMK